VILIAAPAADFPSWTEVVTAIGTVGVAVAAVGIALWTEWRSGKRLEAEHQRSDRMLKEERARSKEEIDEERRGAREREQLAQAYAVQVVLASGFRL
jgi:ADP-ribosylglycohydrolase